MKVLIDTSIFFPALDTNHTEHEKALPFLKKVESDSKIIVLNTHLMAELFNNLSKKPRLVPEELPRIQNVLHRLNKRYETVELTNDDYLAAVDRCVELGLRGAVIYDALHFQAAIKAKVEILYTANLSDFERLMTDEVPFRLASPF